MLRQTLTSQPFTYRLPADLPAPGGTDLYNLGLITPPRIYGEEYDGFGVMAMFVNDEITVDGYECFYLFLNHNQVNWPGYLYRLHRWDATTGAYLGGADSQFPVTQHLFSQSRNGTLYSMDLLNKVRQFTIDPVTHDLTTDDVIQFDFSSFSTFTGPTAYLIDTDLGLLMGNGDLSNFLTIWDLATGTIQYKIPLPSFPLVVMAESTPGQCYVSTSDGAIVLVDYQKRQAISSFHIQVTPQSSPFAPTRSICWDRKYRRFLNWINTPVTTEGQNTSIVTGYYPTPIATAMTVPVPIRAPRKYRTTPILTRVFGDMGEPIGGTQVTLSFPSGTSEATVGGFPSLTDGDGEAIGSINDLAAGAPVLTASATV